MDWCYDLARERREGQCGVLVGMVRHLALRLTSSKRNGGWSCGWLLSFPLLIKTCLLPTPSRAGTHCSWVPDLAVISGVSYQGKSKVTFSASLPSLSFLVKEVVYPRWSPTKPFLAFLLVNGMRHCISPTSLLSWWFQVPVMPSVFPALSRAAVYGGAGCSLHKDILPRE